MWKGGFHALLPPTPTLGENLQAELTDPMLLQLQTLILFILCAVMLPDMLVSCRGPKHYSLLLFQLELQCTNKYMSLSNCTDT